MPCRGQVAAGRATWTTALPVLVALAAVSSAQATFTGRNGRLAVSWYFGDCARQIATIRPDGERFRRLTSCRSGAEDPEWSPDGRRLLYVRDGGVRVMAADGSRQRFVPPPAPPIDGVRVLRAEPSFAPDGKRFAYTARLERGAEIWTARLDGSRDRRLRAGSAPRWSPDGRRIALSHGDGIVIVDAGTGRRIRRIHMSGNRWTGRRTAEGSCSSPPGPRSIRSSTSFEPTAAL
jgi:hypothetical protein